MAGRMEAMGLAGYGQTVLRFVVGLTFFLHGWQKLFSDGIGGVAGFFGQIGVPAPWLAAPLVTGLELVGGLLLMVGLFTRWVSIPLVITMLVAGVVVHLSNGFFVGGGGVELVLLLAAGLTALALAGPGALALDGVRLRDRQASEPERPVERDRLDAAA